MTPKYSKLETQVLPLLEANLSTITIANILKKTAKSIQNTLYRIKQKNNNNTQSKTPKNGRPKSISQRTTRSINRDLTRSPKKENKTIIEDNSLKVSTRSLQRVLKEQGYSIKIAKKKSILDAEKASNRLIYARKTSRNLENIDFSKVIFSDESSIQRGHGARNEYVRKRQNKRVGKEFVSTTNKSK